VDLVVQWVSLELLALKEQVLLVQVDRWGRKEILVHQGHLASQETQDFKVHKVTLGLQVQ